MSFQLLLSAEKSPQSFFLQKKGLGLTQLGPGVLKYLVPAVSAVFHKSGETPILIHFDLLHGPRSSFLDSMMNWARPCESLGHFRTAN